MATKIGKYYITRNNPRELLREIANYQNIIDEASKYLKDNPCATWYYVDENKKVHRRDKELEEILEKGKQTYIKKTTMLRNLIKFVKDEF